VGAVGGTDLDILEAAGRVAGVVGGGGRERARGGVRHGGRHDHRQRGGQEADSNKDGSLSRDSHPHGAASTNSMKTGDVCCMDGSSSGWRVARKDAISRRRLRFSTAFAAHYRWVKD